MHTLDVLFGPNGLICSRIFLNHMRNTDFYGTLEGFGVRQTSGCWNSVVICRKVVLWSNHLKLLQQPCHWEFYLDKQGSSWILLIMIKGYKQLWCWSRVTHCQQTVAVSVTYSPLIWLCFSPKLNNCNVCIMWLWQQHSFQAFTNILWVQENL